MLLIILLVLSVMLNIVLIFGIVRKRDEEDLMVIKLREKLRIE